MLRRVEWKQPPYASIGTAALCGAVVLAAAASLPSPTRTPPTKSTRIPDAEIAAGVSLIDIDHPAEALASKVVQATSGERVGRVSRVLLLPDGAAKVVEVELAKSVAAKRTARINPDNLLYLPHR